LGDPRDIITSTTKSPRLLQYENSSDKQSITHNSQSTNNNNNNLLSEKHFEYINHLETQFDRLMKRKQQLEAEITRLPYKATNTNMHVIKTSLENEMSSVDKQLASIKLEMRKMNIIKSNH
jgi:predicted  nucleic acid-binding Zn-ribbon protein